MKNAFFQRELSPLEPEIMIPQHKSNHEMLLCMEKIINETKKTINKPGRTDRCTMIILKTMFVEKYHKNIEIIINKKYIEIRIFSRIGEDGGSIHGRCIYLHIKECEIFK